MKFVFIGGVPRSGTTMLQKILGNHPQISAGPEFDNIPVIMDLFKKMKSGIKSGRQEVYYNQEFLKQNFNLFIESLFKNRITNETVYISEKTPSNALVFKELLDINTNNKLVFIVRDPRGIAASMKEVCQKAKKNNIKIGLHNKIYRNLKLMDNYYKALNDALKLDSERIYIIYYEDILENSEKSIPPLFKFLGLNLLSEVLDTTNKNETSKLEFNPTASSWYSKEKFERPISKEGIDSWKNVLTPLESNYIERYYLYRNTPFLKKYNFVKKNVLFDFWQSIFYKFYKP